MRLAAILAAAFTLLSGAVLAEPSQYRPTAVSMSEAELDGITAGAVTTLSIILTPGNGGNPDIASSTNPSGGLHIQCHNCTTFGGGLEQGPAQGLRLMINNGHPEGKVRCFGGFSSPIC
jgi:hypothetical protein